MENWVVGIDLGGSKVALSLIGPDDAALASRRFPTETLHGPQFAVANIKQAVDAMIAETGITPRAIGVAARARSTTPQA